MVRSETFRWIGARKGNIENNLNAEDLLDGSGCVPDYCAGELSLGD